MKKELSFICPYCKEKQDGLCEWQHGDIGYDFDFGTCQFEMRDIEYTEHDCWTCPSCGEEIDLIELPKNIQKLMKDNGYL